MKLKKRVTALLAVLLLLLFVSVGEGAGDDITGIWVNGEGENQKYFEFTASGEMKSNADGNEVSGTYTAQDGTITAEINYMGIKGKIKWDYSLDSDALTINGVVYKRLAEEPDDAELILGKWIAKVEDGSEMTMTFDTEGVIIINTAGVSLSGEYTLKDGFINVKLNMLGSVMEESMEYLLEGDALTITDGAVYERAAVSEGAQTDESIAGAWKGTELNDAYVFTEDGSVTYEGGGIRLAGTYTLDAGVVTFTFDYMGVPLTSEATYAISGDTLTLDGAVYARDENATVSEPSAQSLIGEWHMSIDGIKVAFSFMPDGKLSMSMSDAVKVNGTYEVNGNKLSLTLQNGAALKTEEVEFEFVGDQLKIDNDLYTRAGAQ